MLLVAVAAGFSDRLTERQRGRLGADLAFTRTVFEFQRSRQQDDAAKQLLDSLAKSIASGKAWKGRGPEPTCDDLTLLAHLVRIEEHLSGMPKRARNPSNRALWLETHLPPLLEQLAGIPCGQPPHKAKFPSAKKREGWARLAQGPLAETILAHHHSKAPATIHKLVSSTSSLLANLLK